MSVEPRKPLTGDEVAVLRVLGRPFASLPGKWRISVVVEVHGDIRTPPMHESLDFLAEARVRVATELEHPIPVLIPSNLLGHVRLIFLPEQLATMLTVATVRRTANPKSSISTWKPTIS